MSATSQSVNLDWTAPESDGGSGISGYVVIYGSPDKTIDLYSRVSVEGTVTNYVLSDKLGPGRTYRFAVAAENSIGSGEFSDFSSSHNVAGKSGKRIICLL